MDTLTRRSGIFGNGYGDVSSLLGGSATSEPTIEDALPQPNHRGILDPTAAISSAVAPAPNAQLPALDSMESQIPMSRPATGYSISQQPELPSPLGNAHPGSKGGDFGVIGAGPGADQSALGSAPTVGASIAKGLQGLADSGIFGGQQDTATNLSSSSDGQAGGGMQYLTSFFSRNQFDKGSGPVGGNQA